MQFQLPEPSTSDLIISNTLKQLIIKDIRHAGGWISFARYMELVLYTSNLGYYNRDSTKLGKMHDFITAPEISPLFGTTLAHIIIELFCQKTTPAIVEFGAGTGKLAFDILSEIININYNLPQYYIIEISAKLRLQQQILLRNFSTVKWLKKLPQKFSGIILCNEVLDAMPINLIIRNQNTWFERGVALDMSENFIYDHRQCDANLLAQISNTNIYQIDYLTEVHPTAINFIRSLAAMLQHEKSAIILIDYGFPAHEYYIPERNQGTLMCHYRHYSHTDPFYLPGLQDITAHIDFTAIARAATENGLELLNYTSQAALLLNAGISKFLLRTSPNKLKQYLPQANAVKKLISPTEMGELFKVLVVGKNIIWPKHMMLYDRRHRL